MQVYGTSKIYLIMASKALNEKLKGTGVEVFAAHPGELLSNMPVFNMHYLSPPPASNILFRHCGLPFMMIKHKACASSEHRTSSSILYIDLRGYIKKDPVRLVLVGVSDPRHHKCSAVCQDRQVRSHGRVCGHFQCHRRPAN